MNHETLPEGLKLRDMLVNDGRLISATITAEQQEKAILHVRRGGLSHFRTHTLQLGLEYQGCGAEAYRGADRLIQKLRKGGFIALEGRLWTWLK